MANATVGTDRKAAGLARELERVERLQSRAWRKWERDGDPKSLETVLKLLDRWAALTERNTRPTIDELLAAMRATDWEAFQEAADIARMPDEVMSYLAELRADLSELTSGKGPKTKGPND